MNYKCQKFGKRSKVTSSCHQKLFNKQMHYNKCGLFQVNVLRGYALKGLKNWPEAFYAFLNVAIKFQDKGIFEKDIVVNIADTYIEYSTFDDGTISSKMKH